MKNLSLSCFVLISFLLLTFISATPVQELALNINRLIANQSLKGIQIQVTNNSQTIFNQNVGIKNEKNESIDNNTLFRVASLSKSFASVAIMQLVQQKKLRLNQTISQILGFPVINPFFPNASITVEMILSHQSSLIQCQPYYDNFLTATYNAKIGTEIPSLRQILTVQGKYYNSCLFSSKHKPGQYFQYVNLNFGIAGTIVQKVSGVRFDIYERINILQKLNTGNEVEYATFDPSKIQNSSNLGSIYIGSQGKWIVNYDNYPSGLIPSRNMNGYRIGQNGVVFGPQGSLRASSSHLTNYIIMLANGGTTRTGEKILSSQSVDQLLKPRYQFHGLQGGAKNDFHLYGFGLYTTTYFQSDKVIKHQVVRGHLGAAYGLISAYFFWKSYTLTYIINGALNGYKYQSGTIYETARIAIHSAVDQFIQKSMALQ